MATNKYFVDFVGLNTLITSSLSLSDNVISSDAAAPRTPTIIGAIAAGYGRSADSLQLNIDGDRDKKILYAINAHRGNTNGGYSSWRQLRVSENPLTRHHVRNAQFTFVTEGDVINLASDSNEEFSFRERHSDLKIFNEPPVTQKSYPLVWNVGRHFRIKNSVKLERFSMISSYSNLRLGFADDEASRLLKFDTNDKDFEYHDIKDLYLDGGLEDEESALTYWEFLKYQETVYPRPENMFRNEVRDRQNYATFYNSKREFRYRTFDGNTSPFPNARGENVEDPFRWGGRTHLGSTSLYGITQSSWPMDEKREIIDAAKGAGEETHQHEYPLNLSQSESGSIFKGFGNGILMNTHVQFGGMHIGDVTNDYADLYSTNASTRQAAVDRFNLFMNKGPLYMRRHTLFTTASLRSPTGMFFFTGALASGLTLHDNMFSLQMEGGPAWNASNQHGASPMYNTYAEFSQAFRSKYKNFTIVPEFRISNHVERILKTGSAYFESDIFEITGGQSNGDNSAERTFYKTYSTTDFLRHFELFDSDHDGFTNSQVLSLKCKAVKKLLPYEGFYPCQRTTDLAARFVQSYGEHITALSEDPSTGQTFELHGTARQISQPVLETDSITGIQSVVTGTITVERPPFNLAPQPVMTPLFAPGILFNTIKSGVACDFPRLTASVTVTSSMTLPASLGDRPTFGLHQTRMIQDNHCFESRIPFEALVEPERHLANKTLRNYEVHASGAFPFTSIWDGQGDELYKLMANNFLAETIEFFMRDQNLTTIVSKKQGDGFLVEQGKVYGMRIRMRRSMDGPRQTAYSASHVNVFLPPQDIGSDDINSVRESITMYSRPSAFGVPSFGFTQYKGPAAGGRNVLNLEPSGTVQDFRAPGQTLISKDSRHGYNFPFTPPYYHGEAWIDIHYTGSTTGKVTLTEILSNLKADYSRFNETYYESFSANGHVMEIQGPQSFKNINNNALQLSASINPFEIGALSSVDLLGDGSSQEVNVVVNTEDSNEQRWVIQTKFETPILNFQHVTASQFSDKANSAARGFPSVFGPGNGGLFFYGDTKFHGQTIQSRGMWHQKGLIPDEKDGVFLQVGPIDENYQKFVLDRGKPDDSRPLYEDLSEVCGFSNAPVKLGRLASAKVIREAVVAVPYIEESNRKKFFLLNEGAVSDYLQGTALSTTELGMGLSVRQQIDKMKHYVFPPSFDFINNKDVDPIAMYIFEFKHTLDSEDLANIWQGLPPKIAREHEESEARIVHPLLAKELLGGGQPGDNTEQTYPEELKWLVFKVKQRAASNYFEKVIKKNPAGIGGRINRLGDVKLDQFGDTTNIQFNWPYDFFSLVELVKIDAELEFGNADFTGFNEVMPKLQSRKASDPSIFRLNQPFLAPMTPPPPPAPTQGAPAWDADDILENYNDLRDELASDPDYQEAYENALDNLYGRDSDDDSGGSNSTLSDLVEQATGTSTDSDEDALQAAQDYLSDLFGYSPPNDETGDETEPESNGNGNGTPSGGGQGTDVDTNNPNNSNTNIPSVDVNDPNNNNTDGNTVENATPSTPPPPEEL